MGRVYSSTFSAVAVTALQDFFSLVVAANEPIKLLYCSISQSSDLGDAEEEGLRISIIRGWGTVGSGGSALAEIPNRSKVGAASASCRSNDTTEASAGTPVTLLDEVWNIRMPWVYLPTPEMAIVADVDDDILSITLLDAPTDEITVSGTIIWEEM